MRLRMEVVRADARKDWALILRGKDESEFYFPRGTIVEIEIKRETP